MKTTTRILVALFAGLAASGPGLTAEAVPAPDRQTLAAGGSAISHHRADRRSVTRLHPGAAGYALRQAGNRRQDVHPTAFKYHLGGTFAYNPADAPRYTDPGSPGYREFRPGITVQRRRFINPH